MVYTPLTQIRSDTLKHLPNKQQGAVGVHLAVHEGVSYYFCVSRRDESLIFCNTHFAHEYV